MQERLRVHVALQISIQWINRGNSIVSAGSYPVDSDLSSD